MYHQHHTTQKGGSFALLILVITASLAILYFGNITVSSTAIEVSRQKQLLDATATLLGNNIIRYGLSYNCTNGMILNDTDALSRYLARQMRMTNYPDTFRCQDLGLITHAHNGQTQRQIKLSSTTQTTPNMPPITRDVIIQINEQSATVSKPDSSITFILDFSGSMSQFNRRTQLINAVNQFIDANYDIKWGVVLFSTATLPPSIPINQGPPHNTRVKQRLNSQPANGSTNFSDALNTAKQQLISSQQPDKHFFVFITDGDPNAGAEPINWTSYNIFNTDPRNCTRHNPQSHCITIYSLGINISPSNVERLIKMSGNAATPLNNRADYFFYSDNNQIATAFDNIIASIMCTWGPITPRPQNLSQLNNLNIFINDQPIPKDNWQLDNETGEISIYNEACDNVLINGGLITARYGSVTLLIP
jgi:hypothetical protein